MGNTSTDYLIPFGIDSAPFKKGIAEIDEGTEKMTANVLDATKTMQKGFNDAATASDNLGKTLVVDAEKAAQLRDAARLLGKEVGAAFNGTNVSSDFEKKVQKFSDMLAKFSANANKPIKFNIETAKLEQFEQALAGGADELKILTLVLEEAQKELANLNPNSQEWQALNAQIEIASGFLEGLGNAAGGAETKQKSLKAQLRELKAALAEMEEAGRGGTQEFLDMSIKAGQLEDQIGDVSQRVRVLASDTKYLDAGVEAVTALAGGFAAAQGAAALFGSENEEVNKVIQKVTGAMAVLQGIQAIANALNKDSTLSVLLFSRAQTSAAVSTTALATAEAGEATAAVAATGATEGLTAALLSNPITAIAVGVAALIAALVAFASTSSEAEKATKELNDELDRQNAILNLDEASLKRRTDVLVAQVQAEGAIAQSRAKNEAERAKIAQETADKVNKIQSHSISQDLALQEQALQETRDKLNDRKLIQELSVDDFKKLQDKELEQDGKVKDLKAKIQIEGLTSQKENADKEIALRKAAVDQAKKDADERKKILEQQLKFTAELEKARIEGITDVNDKDRAQARAAATQQIAQLEAEKSLSVKAEKTKQEAIKAIRAGLSKQLSDIDLKEGQDKAALALKASQIEIDGREEGIVKEIETIRLGFEEKKAEINKEFKDDEATRVKLIEHLNDAQIKATQKAQNNQLKLDEERAVLEVETAAKFLPNLPGIEEKKQVEILKVKIKFAEQSRQQLIDQGNAENSTVVLQATKAVQDLKKQLGVAVQAEKDANGGVDFFKLFNLDGLSEDQRKIVTDTVNQSLQSITQLTDFIVGQFQRQIDKKKEVIKQTDDDLKTLEDQLQKEQDLREAGLANNVEAVQTEIAEKKKAREEEVKQAEELQKRQQAIQKAQLALDTAIQASDLVTASAKIFRSLADIPFVGVPLAIATIALMTGAFITAKVKAFQVVNDQKQTFGEGGFIDGKPHSQGGKKYRAIDGNGLVELEGGEYVTNKNSTAKYADLLEAINNDDLAGMNEDTLRDMLQSLGIHLSTDAPQRVLKIVRERDDFKQAALMNEKPGSGIGSDVQEISHNVKYLADKERSRVDRWQDDEYYYTKEGNKTTKIKKG